MSMREGNVASHAAALVASGILGRLPMLSQWCNKRREAVRGVVVEPDALTGKVLQLMLGEAGHEEVTLVGSASEAIREVVGRETDMVLLEVDLPDRDGYELCKNLRSHRYTGPLIMITQRQAMQDKLQAFHHGADDVIVKPFDPREVVARVEAVSRRWKRMDYQVLGTVLKVGDAELSIGGLTLCMAGRPPVQLTPTELRLLECLMRNSEIAISRDTLIERTWGYDSNGDNHRLEVAIRRLREKIEPDPARPTYLHTVRGIGYVFRSPVRADAAGSGHDRQPYPLAARDYTLGLEA